MADVYRKARSGAPDGFFAAEAAGLRWLSVPGGVRVANVIDVGPDYLDLERIPGAHPTVAAARALGRGLAVVHDAGAEAFGALPPDGTLRPTSADPRPAHRPAYFGPLADPLDMVGGSWDDWPSFYAEARLRPVLEQGRERGVFTAHDAGLVERVCARLPQLAGPILGDAPARLHGDLWSGNVLWTPGLHDGSEAILVDPAAHGGHREADLAMLALFGAPYLDDILSAYDETHPLARGWQHRVSLHQLYPLAVHAVLFGRGYVVRTRSLLDELAG